MDTITSAIVAAIAAVATEGITDIGKQAIRDAYNGLKDLVSSRFGKESDLAQAITKVEQDPESEGRQMVLSEEVKAAQAYQEPDIVSMAEALREILEKTEAGRQAIAKYNIDARGAQVGIVGDNAHVEGGIHLGEPKK